MVGHWSFGVLDEIANVQLAGLKRAEQRAINKWASKIFPVVCLQTKYTNIKEI